MMRAMRLSVAMLAILTLGPVARASILVFETNLDGPTEGTPSLGTGFGRMTVDDVAKTMRVEFNFTGLTGTSSAAHIHGPTAAPNTGTAGVATQTPFFEDMPIGVTSGSYDHTFDMTLASSYNGSFITNNGGTPETAFTALIAAMTAERAYLNLHSNLFPSGEIRGFLRLVPEPGSLALLGAGLVGVAVIARRRRARG